MRGKAPMVWSLTGAPGITPAYAGKSCRRLERRSGKEDHPRMCGEKQIKGFKHDGHMGSPPHVRGKGELSRAGASTSKITPAYAGKSWNSLALKCLLMGSPPRMRGKADGHRKARRRTRITPAYAGKRQPLPGWSKSERDHPRVCGEKTACGLPWLPPWGSPPRMRGKAGSRSASGSACRDHPRVCGEKQRKWMPRICTKGSPPRMRGKGIEQSNCRVGMRITPAYAGKRCCVFHFFSPL